MYAEGFEVGFACIQSYGRFGNETSTCRNGQWDRSSPECRGEEHNTSIEFFTIGVSVRLSDRSLQREEQKKKFVKNCP